MVNVTILGNNSALPAFDRHPTAQTVAIRDQLFLVDCGEGTQIRMMRFGLPPGHINHIFISHLHGDHYFGLIGLLSSLALWHREKPLHLYAPPVLKDIINIHLTVIGAELPYPFLFHSIEPDFIGILLDTQYYSVRTFPVNHRIPCHGFVFCEKTSGRKLNPEACRKFGIPKSFFNSLKKGEDYQGKDGSLLKNDQLTFEGKPNKTYAFCADTLYDPSIIPYIKGVDLLYHESTFLDDNEEKAFNRYHSTAKQAARIAVEAGVKKLLLGHYSSRYQDLSLFEKEAKTIFPNTEASIEGKSYLLK